MNTWTIAALIYFIFAIAFYLWHNLGGNDRGRKPPRPCLRWATPWYCRLFVSGFGNWLIAVWWQKRGFPEWGFRLAGFEFWVEYWRE